MEIDETVIENIRKQIKAYREENMDREKKINVLLESIRFEEDNLSAAAIKKYAGRYFLANASDKNMPRIIKLNRFEKIGYGWTVKGDYFWFALEGGHSMFNIEKNKRIYLTSPMEYSLAITIANFEKEYTEISKEEFQKYKDAAVKNFIDDL